MVCVFEFVFDADECTVEDDAGLEKVLKLNAKAVREAGSATTLLCTPEVCEDESAKWVMRWRKLDKVGRDCSLPIFPTATQSH